MRDIVSAMVRVMLCTALAFWSIGLYAQTDQNYSATLIDAETKQPLEGVTVRVGNANLGKTDARGVVAFKGRSGQSAIFTFVGYERQSVSLGASQTITVRLKQTAGELDEVVVSMDLRRKPRELGFSNQRITGAEVQETQRENFVNALQGRVAGATITPTNGLAGASSSIVLRGFNSLALSNQPIFVVDGVILDNQTVDENSNTGSGLGLASDRPNRNNDYTNRIADINPNDIETMTVLKGPEATALYGSQASSGAIIITTKKAKPTGKVRVFYDNSFRVSELTRFPDVSYKWQSGTNGSPENSFTYFGPAMPADRPFYNNVENFFNTGFAQTHNLSAEYGRQNSSWRISGSLFDQTGVVPNNDYTRYNLRISNSTKIFKNLEIAPAVSFVQTKNMRPRRGAGGYLLNLVVWPSDNDIRNYQGPDGNKVGVYAADPSTETDNPMWNAYNNAAYDETNRYVFSLGVNYNPFKWLAVNGRFGYDTYNTDGWSFYHPQSFVITPGLRGEQDNFWRNYYGYNHTITATARKTLGKFSGRLMGGTMWQDYETQMFAQVGNQLADIKRRDSASPSVATRRYLNQNVNGKYNQSITRQFAMFGEAQLSFNNYLFLTYSHRWEQSSTLPKASRKFNYPGASMSLILSDLFPGLKSEKFLSYWKIRASTANTARLNSAYSNQSVFNNVLTSGGGVAYGFTNNNPDLVPEIQNTYELGTEFRLFKERLTVDVAYYNTLNEKQIVENFRSSYGTGFVLNTLNTATTRNQGVELVLTANLIQNKNFRWTMTVNGARMWNEVLFLPGNVPEFYIADTWLYGNARGGLVKGGPTTSITSFGYLRNNAGDIIINPSNGIPVVEQLFKVRGDRNPDAAFGINNDFRYKNWSLKMLWDFRIGGDVFNATNMYMTTRGRSPLTDDRKTPIVVKGVLRDGLENTSTPTPNNIAIQPYFQQDYYTTMPEEAFIEKNINWARLRDLTLNYTFGPDVIKKIKFVKSLAAFATVNDLILISNYTGADPAVNGNTAGSRGVGAAGFDYGNIGTPVSWNFGIRTSF